MVGDMSGKRSFLGACAVAGFAIFSPLAAQQRVSVRNVAWTPFLGCWSSSSSGMVGPMVCVVPTESPSRAEFLTVSDDSVVSRAIVDASGIPIAQSRNGCVGWETSRWSKDSTHLFSRADYRCADGHMLRADEILSMTHADAFSLVVRSVTDDSTPARVVNFIVQLDTTLFPPEVRQRLTSYRTLAESDAELETIARVPLSDQMEAAMEIDGGVIDAWLADRGQRSDLTARELRSLHTVARVANSERRFVDRALAQAALESKGRPLVRIRRYALGNQSLYNGSSLFGNGRVVTPVMVNFSYPPTALDRGFAWHGWP